MRGGIAATIAATLVMAASGPAPAVAQDKEAVARPGAASEMSAQRRRGTQLRVYRQILSPNAVRACSSWYELEYRPSGTVLVPRMRCQWVNG